MDTGDRVYRVLQKHLDRLPVEFPATGTGVEIRLLKMFFTLDEAALATQLSMHPEPLERIYRRIRNKGAKLSREEMQKKLDHMACRGTVIVKEENGEKLYGNRGMGAGGIQDFQLNSVTEDLARTYHEYMRERPKPGAGRKRSPLPLRTIPVQKSIPLSPKFQVGSYDDLRKIIENVPGPIAVARCICRGMKDVMGESCHTTHLRETCFMIGPEHAKAYVNSRIARYITKEEAFTILEEAQKDGLVIQPENSQRPEAICCCCGDCCLLLTSLKKLPQPAKSYASTYYAAVDAEICQGCGSCVKRCQLDAVTLVDGKAKINLDRCIGCGNCVAICPSQAVHLEQKEKIPALLKDKQAYNMRLLSDRFGQWETLKIRMKTLFGAKV